MELSSLSGEATYYVGVVGNLYSYMLYVNPDLKIPI